MYLNKVILNFRYGDDAHFHEQLLKKDQGK